MDISLILLPLLVVMLVFMFFNTRKRQKQMKAQQEEKATKTVPGAKVLLQGGIYGTIVSYDPVDLDKPAEVEVAPGVVIEVHSQAILRLVEPTEPELDDTELPEDITIPDNAAELSEASDAPHIESPEETKRRLDRDADK
ncbi:preprotein translocase subunit YajC [Microbacterium sp.]|uniref:preprotein translocase subunit YajC n=1 Tax=Microbacterium sp. TaxID=51671 RepID=UPI00333F86C2